MPSVPFRHTPLPPACPECGSTSYQTLGTCSHPACTDTFCDHCGITFGANGGFCRYHTQELANALKGPEPEIAEQDEAQEWQLLAAAGCTLDEARAYLAHYEGKGVIN